jgi:hypothetical protein
MVAAPVVNVVVGAPSATATPRNSQYCFPMSEAPKLSPALRMLAAVQRLICRSPEKNAQRPPWPF